MESFDNNERRCYYGLKIGDIVTSKAYSWGDKKFQGTVIDYVFMDNNVVQVLTTEGNIIKCVAEWMTIEVKVEDRDDFIEIE
jgi:hypothetical protein